MTSNFTQQQSMFSGEKRVDIKFKHFHQKKDSHAGEDSEIFMGLIWFHLVLTKDELL